MEKQLLEDNAIKVDRKVINKIGLKEAIIFQSIKDLQATNKIVTLQLLQETLPFLHEETIARKIKFLIANNYIKTKKLDPETKLNILKTKNLKGLGIGDYVCPCCNCRTFVLHEHHYPIPKHLGGKETILLCPNCHYEYHYLDNLQIFEDVI